MGYTKEELKQYGVAYHVFRSILDKKIEFPITCVFKNVIFSMRLTSRGVAISTLEGKLVATTSNPEQLLDILYLA